MHNSRICLTWHKNQIISTVDPWLKPPWYRDHLAIKTTFSAARSSFLIYSRLWPLPPQQPKGGLYIKVRLYCMYVLYCTVFYNSAGETMAKQSMIAFKKDICAGFYGPMVKQGFTIGKETFYHFRKHFITFCKISDSWLKGSYQLSFKVTSWKLVPLQFFIHMQEIYVNGTVYRVSFICDRNHTA